MSPKVTVIMAMYNRKGYAAKAIGSILRQSFKNFELIIVNNGSTARTNQFLSRYADKRIRIINKTERLFPSQARNLGLRFARGGYIAIMDSDDISHPQRLAKQVQYLDRHPEVGILGTHEKIIDRRNAVVRHNHFPTDHAYIQWSVLFGDGCLSHPSVMMRTALLKRLGCYAPGLRVAEDYELWSRAIFKTRITNLPEPLMLKRVWDGNISLRHAQTERKIVMAAMLAAMNKTLDKPIAQRIVKNLFWMERKILLANFKPKTKIDHQIMAHCRRLEKGLSIDRVDEVKAAAEVLLALYHRFLKTLRLTQEDKKKITRHLLGRLSFLGRRAKSLGMPDHAIQALFRVWDSG